MYIHWCSRYIHWCSWYIHWCSRYIHWCSWYIHWCSWYIHWYSSWYMHWCSRYIHWSSRYIHWCSWYMHNIMFIFCLVLWYVHVRYKMLNRNRSSYWESIRSGEETGVWIQDPVPDPLYIRPLTRTVGIDEPVFKGNLLSSTLDCRNVKFWNGLLTIWITFCFSTHFRSSLKLQLLSAVYFLSTPTKI